MIEHISWRRVGLVVAALAIAFGSGGYLTPKRVEVKTVTQTVDRVVEKRVEVQSEAKERIVYRDRSTINHPDGTVEHRDITETDKSDTTKDAKSDAKDHETIKTVVEEKTVTREASPNWFASVGVGASLNPITPVLTGQLARRLFGPVYLAGWLVVDTNGQNPMGGLSLGVSF